MTGVNLIYRLTKIGHWSKYYETNVLLYFPINPNDPKVGKKAIVLREAEAWQFEALLFFIMNPKYKKYVEQINCKIALYPQLSNLKKHVPDDRILEYIAAAACPESM